MKKFTFDCFNDKTKTYGMIIIIVARDKHEAIEILSKKYHSKTNYYDSRIQEIELKDNEVLIAEAEALQCYNEIYKNNTIALGLIIASMGANICNLQRAEAGAKYKDYTCKQALHDVEIVLNR